MALDKTFAALGLADHLNSFRIRLAEFLINTLNLLDFGGTFLSTTRGLLFVFSMTSPV